MRLKVGLPETSPPKLVVALARAHDAVEPDQRDQGIGLGAHAAVEVEEFLNVERRHHHAREAAVRRMQGAGELDGPLLGHPAEHRLGDEHALARAAVHVHAHVLAVRKVHLRRGIVRLIGAGCDQPAVAVDHAQQHDRLRQAECAHRLIDLLPVPFYGELPFEILQGRVDGRDRLLEAVEHQIGVALRQFSKFFDFRIVMQREQQDRPHQCDGGEQHDRAQDQQGATSEIQGLKERGNGAHALSPFHRCRRVPGRG